MDIVHSCGHTFSHPETVNEYAQQQAKCKFCYMLEDRPGMKFVDLVGKTGKQIELAKYHRVKVIEYYLEQDDLDTINKIYKEKQSWKWISMHNDLFSVNKLPAVKEISGFRDKVMEYIDKNKDKITDKQWMLAYKQLTFFDNDIVE